MAVTTSAYDVELTGTLPNNSTPLKLGLMLAPPAAEGDARTIAGTLEAISSDVPVTPSLGTREWVNQGRGVGIDYDWAPGSYTRTPGYVCPAGYGAPMIVHATPNAKSVANAFAEYKGDLYVGYAGVPVTQAGMVVRYPGGGGSGPVLMGLSLAVGEFVKDMLVADDGSGNQVLWVTSGDNPSANGGRGRIHKWDGTAWASSPGPLGAGSFNAAGLSVNRIAQVYWMTADGNGAWRLVTIMSDTSWGYTRPNSDPLNPANWVGPLKIGTSGQLIRLLAFKRHIYLFATDGIYDVNDQGESQEITSYLRTMLQQGNANGAVAHNGYLYVAVGRGLIRTYVEPGQYDESPLEGQCAPGWGTPSEAPFRGFAGPMLVDQGHIVCPVYNPSTKTTSIFWGVDRRVLGVPSRNPLIWYGPEVYYQGDYQVNAMWVTGLVTTGALTLCLGMVSNSGGDARFDRVSLPIAGSPLQDLNSGGAHRFCSDQPPPTLPGNILQPFSRIESLVDPGPSDADLDLFVSHALTTRATTTPTFADTHVTFETRADPAVGTSAGYAEVAPPTGITNTPLMVLTPVAPTNMVQGYATQWRARFIANNGHSNFPEIPVLRTVRSTVLQRVTTNRVIELQVQYGDGVPGPRDDATDPDEKTRLLVAATSAGPLTLRARSNKLYTVILRQVLTTAEEWFDGGIWNKRVTTTLQVQLMSGPPPA